MQTTQGNMLVSLHAVETFLDDNAAALVGVINTGARQKLKAAIADLSVYASDQTGGALISQSSTQGKQSLRLALVRDHMAQIARIAQAELPHMPQVAPLRLPRGRPTIPKLVSAAEGMAKAAAPYAGVFIGNGLPIDFIEQLNAAAGTLLASVSDHTNIQGKRKTATKGVKAKLTVGRRIVHILDTYVKSALKDDPNLLAGWNTVKRVQRTGTRASATVTPASATASVPTST